MGILLPHIEAMSGYVPGEQPAAGTKLIKLNTNENPYPPTPEAARAIREELEGAATGERLRLYSDPTAGSFRQAAADAAGLALDNVMCGNGSDELLALLFRGIVGPGDRVAYPYPTYVLYETLARMQDAALRTVDFDRNFALPDGLSDCGAKLVLLANPNSPSGTLIDPEQLRRLASQLGESLLLVDEAYVDFGDGRTALPLVSECSNVAVLRTLSKSHSLAGMRLGMLYGPAGLVAGLWKIKDSYNLDRLAISAGAAALRDPTWTENNIQRVKQTRERLASTLRSLGLEVLPSHANFVFARFRSKEAAEGAYRFLRQQGVLVRYFAQRLLADGIRITVGTDDEIDALLQALETYQSAES
jgi:histidinol-phosphate aminotransferase